MDRDPVLYHVLETNYNGEVTSSTLHLFDEEGDIVWSRYSHGAHRLVPYEELAEQLVLGNEAMGRLFQGEFDRPAM